MACARIFLTLTLICETYNVGRGVAMPLSAHPKPEDLLEHLIMDFIKLTQWRRKRNFLIIVNKQKKKKLNR